MVNHEILFYIRGASYKWFQPFLCQRLQYTRIKESESSLNTISHGVPQGSVLGPLLFILYINDMHNSVNNCKIHHFVDDTTLLLTNSSLKKINKQVNHDPSLICHWLRANKISLNTSKTETIIFRPRKK